MIPTEAKEFLENWGMYKREWQYYLRDERLYALGKKDGMPENLRYLRTGLYLGECKKKRFEPSQALAMVLDGEGENRIHLNRDDPTGDPLSERGNAGCIGSGSEKEKKAGS